MKELHTERLTLRGFRESDGPALYAYLSDSEVVRYEPYRPLTREEAEKEAARRAEDENFWAVCLPDGTLIGNLYFSKGEFDTWELGYVFHRAYWGNGYALESARALLRHGFEALGAHRVTALCNPENQPSWRLMERLGMRREGHLLQNVFFFRDGQDNPLWQDTYQYAILKAEFLGGR